MGRRGHLQVGTVGTRAAAEAEGSQWYMGEHEKLEECWEHQANKRNMEHYTEKSEFAAKYSAMMCSLSRLAIIIMLLFA